MKKLFLLVLLFAASFSGCMHYATPHGRDITIKNIERLPVKVGLYLPEAISKDSVEVDIGDILNWTHLNLLRSGAAMADAIHKAASVSVNEVVVLDSNSDQKQIENDSLAFLILPQVIRRTATIWPSAWNFFKNYGTSTFESQLKLNLTDKHGVLIDSILINAVGLSGRILDSSHVVDSVIADAADSAIASIQDQIVFNLTRNNKLRSYLRLPNPANGIAIVTPATHGLYGSESKFEFDTISYSLTSLPNNRRWSIWDEFNFMPQQPTFTASISIAADLMLYSHLSFRLGIAALNYYYHGLDSFTFVNNQFQLQSNDISRFDWILLTRVSYLFFGPRNFLEVGLGLNTELGKWFTGKITVPDQQRFQPLGIIGYRHQSIWFGSTFGANYMPYLDAQGLKHGFAINVGFGL